MARFDVAPGSPGGTTASTPDAPFTGRWPAYAIAWSVGLFCGVVGAAWVWDHLVRSTPVDETAWVILGSLVLRVGTIGVALASVQRWGRLLPTPLVLTGLWGCAAAQLAYPLAELVVKLLVLVGAVDLPARGIGNMTATGWFNFGAAWVVFGIPGLLFVLAARSYAARRGGSWGWPVVGLLAGTVALAGIGLLIG